LEANWKWGNFYYNVSFPVSSIDGCQISSKGNSLTLAGLGNQIPLILDVNLTTGSLNSFTFLEENTQSPISNYVHSGAIYYDESDFRTLQPFFYTAFIKDSALYLLRVSN